MSIDYFTCKHCGESFPDCEYYVSCSCGNRWCSDECAIEDGYEEEIDSVEEVDDFLISF